MSDDDVELPVATGNATDQATRMVRWWGLLQRWTVRGGKTSLNVLKAMSPYAWALTFTVSVLSLTVSLKVLSLQRSGNRPEIIFNRTVLENPYDDGIFNIGMQNVGTRTAYNYQLQIKTVGIQSGQLIMLETVDGSNPIAREGGISAQPRLDMSKYLDVLVLCAAYNDDDGNVFKDVLFVNFPTMKRGLKKDKGGGGQYLAASVSPDTHSKLEKMHLCQ